MAAYSGKTRRIKNALMLLLSSIKLDAGQGPEKLFTQVVDNPDLEFDSYPSARVLPDGFQSDKWSTQQNKRIIPFVVSVYLQLENQPSQSAVVDQMCDITDLLFDTIDGGDLTGALNQIDPTIGTFIVRTNRSLFMVDQAQIGKVLWCDLNVEVEYAKDF